MYLISLGRLRSLPIILSILLILMAIQRQIVWTAVSIDNPPGRHKKIADTDLVTVVLDASTAEDIQSRIDRVPPGQWRPKNLSEFSRH